MTRTTIYGEAVEAKVGSTVRPEGWYLTGELRPSNWDRAQFYLTTNSLGPIKELAVNIEITGKTWRRLTAYTYGIRCRIEFVGDGEPSTFSHGWLYRAENY